MNPWVSKIPGGERGNPLQYSCLENSVDRGAYQAIVHAWDYTESDTTEAAEPVSTQGTRSHVLQLVVCMLQLKTLVPQLRPRHSQINTN